MQRRENHGVKGSSSYSTRLATFAGTPATPSRGYVDGSMSIAVTS